MSSLLTAIYIYPIKSCQGIAVDSAHVEPRGLKHDRRWMLVDKNGRFISQRELPRMCLIRVELKEDSSLKVSAPDVSSLLIPLNPSGEKKSVEIWRDPCEAIDQGDEAATWFSTFLKQPVRLVYQLEELLRPVDPKYGAPSDPVSFADAFPALVISEESLADLNRRLARPIEMIRFRPNFVLRGCEPYAEDEWKKMKVGDVLFDLPKLCSRCSIPTVNPATGEMEKEPLTTLSTYRKTDGKVFFGKNCIPRSLGTIRVGDRVTV